MRTAGVDTESINARSVRDGIINRSPADITVIEYHSEHIDKITQYIEQQHKMAIYGVRPVYVLDIRHIINDKVEILKARESGADIFFTSPLTNKLVGDAVSKSVRLQIRTQEVAQRYQDLDALVSHCRDDLHQINDTVKLNFVLDQLRFNTQLAVYHAIARRQPDKFLSSKNKLTLAKLLIDLQPERSESLLTSLVDVGVFHFQANTALYETYMSMGKEELATEALVRSQITRSDDTILFKKSVLALVKQGQVKSLESFIVSYLQSLTHNEQQLMEFFGVLYEAAIEHPKQFTKISRRLTPVLARYLKRVPANLRQQASVYGYLIDAIGMQLSGKPAKAMLSFDLARRTNGPHGYLFEEMQLIELMYLSVAGEYNYAYRSHNRIQQNENINADTIGYTLTMDRYRELVDAERALISSVSDEHQFMVVNMVGTQYKFSQEMVNRSLHALRRYSGSSADAQKYIRVSKRRIERVGRALSKVNRYKGSIPSVTVRPIKTEPVVVPKSTWSERLMGKIKRR
ncbi:hypothetical protein P7F88_07310 [Vibrio hannami]|uniref:hypothetical protein n=1 Tax=Vibrio hannami TaxID=2717094 RepID=UPI00240FBF03|nr:hypothetical protein [Vibrio hannami]MDG3085915.1 hypothetical protein [Vibrio hannami]